jgi:hypothetical protein
VTARNHARSASRPRAIPLPEGTTLPAPTCHLAHCSEPPAPGCPSLLCVRHDTAAKGARMLVDGRGVTWGACLRGCTGRCELVVERRGELVRPTTGCEHLPAHMIRIAQRRPWPTVAG